MPASIVLIKDLFCRGIIPAILDKKDVILHQVIHTDLGGGDGCQVDCRNVIEHGLLGDCAVLNHAVDISALMEQDRVEIDTDLAFLDLTELLLLDLSQKSNEGLVILGVGLVMRSQTIRQELRKEEVYELAVSLDPHTNKFIQKVANSLHLDLFSRRVHEG